MTLELAVEIEAEGWYGIGPVEADIEGWATAAAAEAGLTDDAEIAVLLCDDAAIRSLNLQWRGLNKATNVLSFPAAGPRPPAGPRPLGDIAVAWETTRREAEQEGKAVRAHLAHLIVHGTLHLLGHDHEEAAAADIMEAAERRILGRLGFDDPYADSIPAMATHS